MPTGFNSRRTCELPVLCVEVSLSARCSDLDWMRDKAARYQEKAAKGEFPAIPTSPPSAGLVKLGNSLLSMMSMTLGMDVLAADSEEKLANLSLGEVLTLAQKNRKSACALSGFASNMGMSPGAC